MLPWARSEGQRMSLVAWARALAGAWHGNLVSGQIGLEGKKIKSCKQLEASTARLLELIPNLVIIRCDDPRWCVLGDSPYLN